MEKNPGRWLKGNRSHRPDEPVIGQDGQATGGRTKEGAERMTMQRSQRSRRAEAGVRDKCEVPMGGGEEGVALFKSTGRWGRCDATQDKNWGAKTEEKCN